MAEWMYLSPRRSCKKKRKKKNRHFSLIAHKYTHCTHIHTHARVHREEAWLDMAAHLVHEVAHVIV